jgi:hypothetical protein
MIREKRNRALFKTWLATAGSPPSNKYHVSIYLFLLNLEVLRSLGLKTVLQNLYISFDLSFSKSVRAWSFFAMFFRNHAHTLLKGKLSFVCRPSLSFR